LSPALSAFDGVAVHPDVPACVAVMQILDSFYEGDPVWRRDPRQSHIRKTVLDHFLIMPKDQKRATNDGVQMFMLGPRYF
jgi:uncharacterized protein YjaG (DUF416 family)